MTGRCICTDAGLQQKVPLRALVLSLTRRAAPLQVAAAQAIHKKMLIRAVWLRRATALNQSHGSCGMRSWRGPILVMQRSQRLLDQDGGSDTAYDRGARGACDTAHYAWSMSAVIICKV